MKKIITALSAIAMILIMTFAAAAVVPLFRSNSSVASAPEKIIFRNMCEDSPEKELAFSKSFDYAGIEVSAYTQEKGDLLYLYDKDMNFICQISDPDEPIMMKDSFVEAMSDPEKRINRDDAIKLAYDHAAETYGAFIRDFAVKSVFEDDYHLVISLAREMQAKDFMAYGPACYVFVMINGDVSFCSYGGKADYKEIGNMIANLSIRDLEEFVLKQADAAYRGKTTDIEIADAEYRVQNGVRGLLIEAKSVVNTATYLAPEIPEKGTAKTVEETVTDNFFFSLEG